jgi:hypothetical protein
MLLMTALQFFRRSRSTGVDFSETVGYARTGPRITRDGILVNAVHERLLNGSANSTILAAVSACAPRSCLNCMTRRPVGRSVDVAGHCVSACLHASWVLLFGFDYRRRREWHTVYGRLSQTNPVNDFWQMTIGKGGLYGIWSSLAVQDSMQSSMLDRAKHLSIDVRTLPSRDRHASRSVLWN